MKNTCPRCALCIRRREEDEELDEEDYELIVRLPLTASVYDFCEQLHLTGHLLHCTEPH